MKKLLAALLALTLLFSLAPMALAASSYYPDDTPYPVEGGNIYIDEETKTVDGADWGTVTSAAIPNGVTTIGSYAFAGCDFLTNVTIPNSVNKIGEYAFAECNGLTSITIPNSVTYLGTFAFEKCGSLVSVTLSNKLSYINVAAFADCTSLTSVTIPSSVKEIGEGAFSGCTGLTSVTIPSSVTTIQSFAFQGCTSLTGITIPSSVKSIQNYVFSDCPNLTDIYFGGSKAQWDSLDGPTVFGGEVSSDTWFDPNITTVHYNSSGPSTTTPAGFTDLVDWNKAPVNWAVDNKFADAKSASVFGTTDPCPRWEVVDMIWKAMGSPEPTATSVPFTDVDPSAPYFKAVCWAYEEKITNGINPTTFGPDTTVERGDAMTFLYRAAKKPAVTVTNTFPDVPVGEYYAAPITWAVNQKTPITTGANGVFLPEESVKRGEMVTFLYRWVVENK